MYRTGIGYDIHPLTPGRKLILGGVEIECPLGLDGYSDADAAAHAIADALLGGAGLPDIGNIFPANEAQYKDADSIKLLTKVVLLVKNSGWVPVFVDCVINAQVPKLNPHLPAMKRILAAAVGCEVNIKAKSGEKIPPVGDASCIICYAVATLERERKNANNDGDI